MARIIDYTQDDDKPFGTGTFRLDDDSEYYLDDPERARKTLEELYGAQDPAARIMSESTQLAEQGSVETEGLGLSKRDRLENAVAKLAGVPAPNTGFVGIDRGENPMRRAVAGPGGGDIDDDRAGELSDALGADAPARPAPSEPDPEQWLRDQHGAEPAPARGPQPSTDELKEETAARRMAQAASMVPRTTGGTDPRKLGPGVEVDQSYSRKGGMPAEMYGQQAQDRLGAFSATNEAIGRHYREDAAASDLAAQQLEAQALEQRKQNAAQQLALQRKEQKYADDRAWLEKDVDDYYDKSKPDPDRLFKERGVFGNIGMAIAQFMGAYASVVTGTPNFANQILDKKIDRDIDAQIEDFRRGKMKRDGQLQRMADRGMSIDQMKSALRLQQEMAVQKEIRAAALREGTRESKQAAESMLLERQEKFVAEENKFRTEALGEETVSGNFVRPTGPRTLSPLEYQKQVNELLTARNEGEYQAHGGAPAERANERSGKQRDEQSKRVAQYAAANEKTAGLDSVERAVSRLEEIDRTNGGFPGVGGGDIGGFPGTDRARLTEEVEQLKTTLSNAIINATPGSKSDSDAIRIAKEAFGEGSEAALRRGMAAMRNLARSQRATIEASADPEAAAEYQRRRDASLLEQAKRARDQGRAREEQEKRKRGGR